MSVFVATGLRIAQEVRYGATSQTLTFQCEVNGHQVAPGASPAVLVFRPGVVEDADATITTTGTVSGNTITYALDASDTATWYLGRGYRAKATWTNSGTTYTTTIAFSVVRNPVNQTLPVNEYELISAHVRLEEALNQVARLGYSGNHYIREAWSDVVRFLTSTHRVAAEVLPREDLNALVLPRARALLCRSLFSTQGDPWWTLYKEFDEEYEAAKRNAPLNIAQGDTNVPELKDAWSQPQLSAAPSMHWGRYGRR